MTDDYFHLARIIGTPRTPSVKLGKRRDSYEITLPKELVKAYNIKEGYGALFGITDLGHIIVKIIPRCNTFTDKEFKDLQEYECKEILTDTIVKISIRGNSYRMTIPKYIIDKKGWNEGEKLAIIEGNKTKRIIIIKSEKEYKDSV